MALAPLCMAVLVACMVIGTSALVPSNNVRRASVTSRRDIVGNALSSIVGGALAPLVTATQPADAAVKGSEVFVGTYSDPNHPGGTRTVRLLEGMKVGDYELVEVVGGGGRGEPKQYSLPAVAFGSRAIIIDFTPKGGPADFTAVIDAKTGGLRFLKDGNVWPRVS